MLTVLLIVGALTVTAVVGYVGQRRLTRRHLPEDPRAGVELLPTSELVIPVRTLAGLLLAFVLLSVFNSYQNAQAKAASEAGSVLAMARASELFTSAARDDMLGRLQCYARSVAGPDWEAQADDGRLSPITDKASDAITLALRKADANTQNDSAISAVLTDDSERVQARIQRADEGRSSVPTEVWLLLTVTVAIMIGGLAVFGHPVVRRTVQVVILAGTTLVFGMTILVIYDLDHPYSGPIQVTPAAMITAEARIAALPGGDVTPPCDERGLPTD